MVASLEHRRLVTEGIADARYPVPGPGRFVDAAGEDVPFISAPDIEQIAGALIDVRSEDLGFLRDFQLAYLWKAKGGKAKGRATFGKLTKPSGLLKHFAGVTYVLWLAADHCGEARMSNWQIEALVCHELLHAAVDEDGEPGVVGHDFEGFRKEVEHYGFWDEGLAEIERAGLQLRLLSAEGA